MECSVFCVKQPLGANAFGMIGEEMLHKGNGIINFYHTSQMPTTLAKMHWAA